MMVVVVVVMVKMMTIRFLTLPRLQEESSKVRPGGQWVVNYEPYKVGEGDFAVFTFFYRSQGKKAQPFTFHLPPFIEITCFH